MSRQVQLNVPILTAKATTGIGTPQFVSDFRNCVISFATASSGNLTVKVQAAIGATCPDFSSAQSATNMWDYVQVVDLNTGVPIDGDTGISVSGTDDFRQFEVNINAVDWLNCVVTARVAGNVTVQATLTDNL